MGAYENNLEHLARPSDPRGREEADRIVLLDYEALWFAEKLREYAYHRGRDERGGIARGLATYIDDRVRAEQAEHVAVYVHTEAAVKAVADALDHNAPLSDTSYPTALHRSIEDELASCVDTHPEIDTSGVTN